MDFTTPLALSAVAVLIALSVIGLFFGLRLKRYLRKMGRRKEALLVLYLGGHPELNVQTPTPCALYLTDRGILIHLLSHFEPISYENVVEAIVELWGNVTPESTSLPGAFITSEFVKKYRCLRITFKDDWGETRDMLFATDKAEYIAQKIRQRRFDYLQNPQKGQQP